VRAGLAKIVEGFVVSHTLAAAVFRADEWRAVAEGHRDGVFVESVCGATQGSCAREQLRVANLRF
jgi:hypothetical protein